jgi:uncharacterized protein YndB with AHSA1/START domain
LDPDILPIATSEELGMAEKTHGEATVQMAAPPEAVYALVSDITRMGEWSPETYRCQWIGDATGPAVGARFKASNRHGIIRWSNKPEVIAAEPGKEFAFRRKAVGGVVDWRYQLAPDGEGGTTVTESFNVVKPTPPVIDWVIDKLMRSDDRQAELIDGIRQTLERIKTAAEIGPKG